MKSSVQVHRLAHLIQQRTTTLCAKTLFQIHDQLITTGLHADHLYVASLFNLCLSNPSTLYHAAAIFCHSQEPITAEWLTMVRRLASETNPFQAISIFRAMFSVRPNSPLDDPFIYASFIKACDKLSAFREGKSIHCRVLRLGLDYNVNVMNALIYFYSSLANSVRCACVLFDKIPQRTVVTVNCMISGYMKNKLFNAGVDLFNRVLGCSFDLTLKPNYVSLVILISGCTEYGDFSVGKLLHSYCHKTGLGMRIEVSNALVDLYAKFGCMGGAVRVFHEMHEQDLVSWNTLIGAYVNNNDCKKAFSLFKEMKIRNIECDRVTLINLISASVNSRDLDMGKVVHGYIKVSGMAITVTVGTALINMYSKCGIVEFARNVFDELPAENIASWNSMIFGYIECGYYNEALGLFNVIQSSNLKPDEITFLGSILACRNSGQLQQGIHVHSFIENSNHHGSTILCNALVDMYAKCGSMSRAKALFDWMPKRDVISWTSIIVGYATNGEGKEALVAFQKMIAEKIEPNPVTFIGVLLACDHAGLVDDGLNMYDLMCRTYHVEPNIEHCGCIIDMHARAGMLEEAYKFVKDMSVEPNAVVWRMLINACRVHCNFDLGLSFVRGLTELKTLHGPEDRVISSNILADAGRWDDVLHARGLMVAQEPPKVAGKSSVSDLVM
ncbi:pentatricopeptide repeat-containing protein At4g33990-like [Malania oleifera]|uniref:pentatricopeptide repeat-containing protein At4g33990-like n=1 Tax=Malania oleifera TaxID=397392 RepID=UPI0025AEB1D8|nr:pentatricopeptide repeat-containing protein At4g33990-like [Malania oleifera]